MIQTRLVNLKRSWLLVLLFCLLGGTSAWSKSLYPWNDGSTLCAWQTDRSAPASLYSMAGVETDTITPPLPSFVCDVVCPDFQVNWISIDADCGQSNGAATVTPVGLPPGTEFVYNWEGGISDGPSAENLAPGVYTVVIGISDLLEDQSLRDCLIETEVIVGTKEGPEVNINKITAGNCADLSGSVKLEIGGGTAPYTISWGDGGSNTLNADGIVNITALAPGDYTFIVTDAAGCLTSIAVTIPQAQNPITLTGTPPSLCTSDDGAITVTMEEGFPPYTITLNDALEITTNNNPYTFENLSVGLYTVKVEYGFVCEAEAAIELNTPGFVCNDGWSVVDPVCPGDPAYLYFDGSGDAQETFQIRQLNSGFLIASVPGNEEVYVEVQYSNYEVRRISTLDDCICEFMLSVEPVSLEAQLTVIDGSCEPGNIIPGSIALSAATGGIPPYALEVTDLDNNTVDASNLSAGTYIATVSDANNCQLSATVEVEGGALIGGIEEQEVVVCEGDTFQPTFDNAGNDNLTFSWTPTTGLSDPTVASPVITPTEDITYVLDITDPNCGTFSDTLVIDFVPGLNMMVEGNAFELGEESTIITVSSDNDSAVYTWYQGDSTVVDDDGNDTFVLNVEQFAPPYYVVGEVNGCPDTLFFNVIPPSEVDFTISVPDIEICEGTDATLQATIIPDTALVDSLVWTNPQGDPLGAELELQLNGLTAGTYTYTITGFSPLGIAQATATVNVLPIPAIDAQPNGMLSLCVTDLDTLVELTATASGYPDTAIVWTGPGGTQLGTGSTIMVQASQGNSQYIATLSSICGDVSDTVDIEVNTAPTPPALPDTLKLCVGDEAVIDVSSYGYPYTWSECNGAVIPVVGGEIVISGGTAGEQCFTFSASNACGNTEAQVIVYVVAEQEVDAQPDVEVLLCAPVGFDTCLTATVSGLPGDCIEWADLDGNVLGTGNELCVMPLVGVSHYIAGVPGLDCITSDTVTIRVEEEVPPPPPALPDTLKLCVGDEAVIDVSSYGYPYTWSECNGAVIPVVDGEIVISGGTAGEQCFTFSASNACGNTEAQVIVYVVAGQEVDAQPDVEVLLCAPVGFDTCLTATVTGLPSDCIEWADLDGNVLGTGNELCVMPLVGVSHYIAGVPGLDCITSDTVTIRVEEEVPPPPPALPDTLKLCVGDEAVIDVSSYGYPYTWSECNGAVIPVVDGEIVISGGTAGEQCFTFSASNACGNTEAQVIVYVVAGQEVDAQPDVEVLLCAPVGFDTCLTATVTGLPGDCIEWADLDGNVLGTGNELCVMPPVGVSQYIAGVPGLDCITSDTVTIRVEEEVPPPPPGLPDTLKLCVGDEAVIDVSSYGYPYTWSECNGAVIPVVDGEIVISGGTAGEQCFTFSASNACGNTEAQVIVYVVAGQEVDAQPDVEVLLCAPVGFDTCLTATVTGLPGDCIEWADLDGNVLGTGNELCVMPPVGVSQYIAGVPGLDCITSDTVTIRVEEEVPPPPPGLPDTLKLCVGDEAAIDVSSYGYPYTWSECNGAVIPVVDGEIVISGGTAGEQCFTFSASNACGSTEAQVIVYVVAGQEVDAQPDVEVLLCAPVGFDTCLTATVTGLPGDCIEWADLDGNVLGTGNELCVMPPVGVSQYIAGVPGLDCITSDTVTIRVEEEVPPPPPALPDTLKLCVGDEAVIDVSSYGYPYTWSECNGAVIPVVDGEIVISGGTAGEQCFTFSASNACGNTEAQVIVYVVAGQEVDAQPDVEVLLCAPVGFDTCLTATVTGLPGDCIEWADLDGNVLGTGNELCVMPPVGVSQYIAGVPGLDCITSDTVTIRVEEEVPPPPPGLPDTLKLCVGDEAVIDVSSYGYPYTWSECNGAVIPVVDGEIVISGGTAGEQCFTFSASNACGNTEAQVIVYVVAGQEVDAQPDVEVLLCAPVGFDTCLTATVTGLPGDCIEWADLDGNVLGTGNELCVMPPVGVSQYIAGVPGLDCITSDTVTIRVEEEVPPPPPGLPDTLKLCVGDEAAIDVSSYGYPYTWSECNGAVIPVVDGEIVISGGTAGEQCFTFSASNACGSTEAQVIVYVVAGQEVDAQPDVEVLLCAPVGFDTCLTATVSGLPGDCIEWADLDGNVLGTGNELCVMPPVGVSQYIAGVPGLDCITSDTVTIRVEENMPPPPPGLPDTLKLCVGDEAVIDVSSYGYPYTWSECNGAVIPVVDGEIVISGGTAGEQCFTFSASNACGNTEAQVIVYVVAGQEVDAQPDVEVLLCAPVGFDTCLTATVTGLPGDCIEWADLDGNVLGTGNELCVMPPVGVSQYIAGVPGLDCITSDTVTIRVEEEVPPPPPALPDTLKLCVGDEAVIDVSSYGYPYTWSECNGAVIPVVDGEIVISGGTAGEQCFTFSASNACGNTEAQVIVYVVAGQEVDAQPDVEVLLCAPVGFDTCLTATVTGLPGDCIEWADLDGNVLGTGNELCVMPPVGVSQYIAGVPGLDCITSDTVTIRVEEEVPPPPPALPDTLKLCVGDEAVIDVSSYGYPYTWSECNGAVIPVVDGEIVISGGTAGEQCFTFSASNACGNTEAQVIVYVVAGQEVDAQPDVEVLLCAPVGFDTCLTATVTGLPGDCIEWADLDGNVLGTGNELCVMPPVGVSHYIAGVPGLDCITSDTVTVMVDTVPPVLPPNIPDTVLLCLNDMTTVEVGDYDYPFIWQDENGDTVAVNEDLVLTGDMAGTTSFVFEATNGCGTVADTLIQVTIDSADIEILPSVDTLVVCDSLAIQLEGFAPLGQAVVWTDGNGTVIDTAVVIEIIPEPGSMTYIASSVELGCVRSDTIVVEYVPEDLSVEITASSILICLGDEVDLEATLDPEGVSATITWYDENFEFIDEGDATTVTPIRSGFVSYFAVAENACAMDTASIEIEVEELDLAIVGGDTSICSGDFATLEVVGCDDCTYEWTPEDRLTDPMAAITDASPLRPSTYQVVVTGEVCRDTLTTSVDVGTCERCEVDKVFIADAFTPNGDQNNDFVCIRSEVMEQFSEIELMIYNRWGQEVFRSNSMDNLCWDGSFDGEALAPDVYGYFLRIVCPGEEGEPDQVFNRQGNITLLR